MVVVLGLSPALASAQKFERRRHVRQRLIRSRLVQQPFEQQPVGYREPVDFSESVSDPGHHPGQHDPAGPTSPGPTTGAPGSSGSSSARRFTNKADCERAGADFLASDPAICHDLFTCA
jgi:hypothetical protein